MRDLQLYQEAPRRPWDERASSFLKQLGDTMARARPPQPAPEAVAAAPEPPPVKVPEKKAIRTIRGGGNEGVVYVTLPAR